MEQKSAGILILTLFFVLPIHGGLLRVQKRDWMGSPSTDITEGDVQCFTEYMELWIHRMRIEGLRLWLSGILRIQVSLASLDHLNRQLSACGFALHKDPDKNYIFRVMYSGCFVQLEHGNYVIVLNLLKRISRFGGRTHNYVMKCPRVAVSPNREHIQCNPDFIQVTRQIPLDSWNNELRWSLALGGSLVVALEDASLIQVNVEINRPNITVQGKRKTILTSVVVMDTAGEFLPLKLVSGHYAYSMEATCPNVNRSSSEETVLHIFKRRMGLTKRGGYDSETLSVSSVRVNQTDAFTWSETSDFVQLVIPTKLIQQIKRCSGVAGVELLQPFFRVDVVLTFKETNHKMHWTMENTLPCADFLSTPSAAETQTSTTFEPPQPSTSKHSAHDTTNSYVVSTDRNLPSAEAYTRETSSMTEQMSSEASDEEMSSTTLFSKVSPSVGTNVLSTTPRTTEATMAPQPTTASTHFSHPETGPSLHQEDLQASQTPYTTEASSVTANVSDEQTSDKETSSTVLFSKVDPSVGTNVLSVIPRSTGEAQMEPQPSTTSANFSGISRPGFGYELQVLESPLPHQEQASEIPNLKTPYTTETSSITANMPSVQTSDQETSTTTPFSQVFPSAGTTNTEVHTNHVSSMASRSNAETIVEPQAKTTSITFSDVPLNPDSVFSGISRPGFGFKPHVLESPLPHQEQASKTSSLKAPHAIETSSVTANMSSDHDTRTTTPLSQVFLGAGIPHTEAHQSHMSSMTPRSSNEAQVESQPTKASTNFSAVPLNPDLVFTYEPHSLESPLLHQGHLKASETPYLPAYTYTTETSSITANESDDQNSDDKTSTTTLISKVVPGVGTSVSSVFPKSTSETQMESQPTTAPTSFSGMSYPDDTSTPTLIRKFFPSLGTPSSIGTPDTKVHRGHVSLMTPTNISEAIMEAQASAASTNLSDFPPNLHQDFTHGPHSLESPLLHQGHLQASKTPYLQAPYSTETISITANMSPEQSSGKEVSTTLFKKLFPSVGSPLHYRGSPKAPTAPKSTSEAVVEPHAETTASTDVSGVSLASEPHSLESPSRHQASATTTPDPPAPAIHSQPAHHVLITFSQHSHNVLTTLPWAEVRDRVTITIPPTPTQPLKEEVTEMTGTHRTSTAGLPGTSINSSLSVSDFLRERNNGTK